MTLLLQLQQLVGMVGLRNANSCPNHENPMECCGVIEMCEVGRHTSTLSEQQLAVGPRGVT
jgi:hypothetical protein